MELSLLTQVPLVVGESVVVKPAQIAALPVMLTVGNAFTVTADVVLIQPVDVCVNVKVTDPAATPVITPALVTVANALLLLVQVPPVVGDNVAVLPTQTVDGAVTVGNAFTVTADVVAGQPVDVCVKVKVAVPAATAVTTPALVTVAMALLLLTQVPPVVGDNVVVKPTHTDALPVMLTVGKAFTVIVAVLVNGKLHPVTMFVASILNVVVDDNAPVGKLMVPPVPFTGLPILL